MNASWNLMHNAWNSQCFEISMHVAIQVEISTPCRAGHSNRLGSIEEFQREF